MRALVVRELGAPEQMVLKSLAPRAPGRVCLHGAYPLERAADALKTMAGGEVKGKIVLTTGDR